MNVVRLYIRTGLVQAPEEARNDTLMTLWHAYDHRRNNGVIIELCISIL